MFYTPKNAYLDFYIKSFEYITYLYIDVKGNQETTPVGQ